MIDSVLLKQCTYHMEKDSVLYTRSLGRRRVNVKIGFFGEREMKRGNLADTTSYALRDSLISACEKFNIPYQVYEKKCRESRNSLHNDIKELEYETFFQCKISNPYELVLRAVSQYQTEECMSFYKKLKGTEIVNRIAKDMWTEIKRGLNTVHDPDEVINANIRSSYISVKNDSVAPIDIISCSKSFAEYGYQNLSNLEQQKGLTLAIFDVIKTYADKEWTGHELCWAPTGSRISEIAVVLKPLKGTGMLNSWE